MGSFFSKPDMPPPAAPPPTPEDPEIEKERRRKRLAAKQRKGRASTLLTSGEGDTSPTPAPVRKLLGGSG